jgi:hypothetical protein
VTRRRTCCAALALLLLLTFATSAAAECAWVLWTQVYDPKTRKVQGGWNLAAAFLIREECVRSQERLESSPVPKALTVACLPDTIDPRGPKAR